MSDIRSKVILLGDASVGKTSIILRYFEGKFSDRIQSTIGTSFFTKTFPDEDSPSRVLQHRMNVWDTCGQERFRAIASVYYKDANVVIFVIEADNVRSLRQVESYLEEVRENISTKEFFVLCVNKIDMLPEYRKEQPITEDVKKSCSFFAEIERFAKTNKFEQVFWTSANVRETFKFIDDAVVSKKIAFDERPKVQKKIFVESIRQGGSSGSNSENRQGGCCK